MPNYNPAELLGNTETHCMRKALSWSVADYGYISLQGQNCICIHMYIQYMYAVSAQHTCLTPVRHLINTHTQASLRGLRM